MLMCFSYLMVGALYMRLNSAYSVLSQLNAELEANLASSTLANDELLGAAETMKDKVKTLHKKYGGGGGGGGADGVVAAEGEVHDKMQKVLLAKVEPMQHELQVR